MNRLDRLTKEIENLYTNQENISICFLEVIHTPSEEGETPGEFRLSVDLSNQGKRSRRLTSYHKTKEEAEKHLEDLEQKYKSRGAVLLINDLPLDDDIEAS